MPLLWRNFGTPASAMRVRHVFLTRPRPPWLPEEVGYLGEQPGQACRLPQRPRQTGGRPCATPAPSYRDDLVYRPPSSSARPAATTGGAEPTPILARPKVRLVG